MIPRTLERVVALRLTVLGNGFRRPYPAVIRSLAVVVLGILVLIAAITIARSSSVDLEVLSVLGGWTVVAVCAFLPAAVVRDDPLHARGFAGSGIARVAVAVALPLTDVVSPVAVLLAVLAVGYIAGWSLAGAGGVAIVVAVVLVVLCLELVRLSTAVGAWLWRRRRGALGRAIAVALLLAALVPVVVPFVGDTDNRTGRLIESTVGIESTRAGLIFVAPGLDAPWSVVLGTLAVVIAAAAGELLILLVQQRGPRPRRRTGRTRLGIFRVALGSPVAAVAARGMVYGIRDPRYSGSLLALPFVPVLMLAASAIGGVPGVVMALVALPVPVLLIGWAIPHNDTAYDSTAIWMHVVSPLRGAEDRLGRIVPPLVLGAVVIAIGTPLVWLAVPRPGVVPVVVGISSAALLGALGISSAVSARFPYAAPSPGSGAFRAPESPGVGGGVQTISFLVALLCCAPAVWAAVHWISDGGLWSWAALGMGFGTGLAILVAGILLGGAAYDRRGPELIDFAVRN